MGSVCRQCHTTEKIRVKSIHAALLSKERPGAYLLCTQCHDAHSVAPVSGGKVSAGETRYCMGCHQYEVLLECRNGEKISLQVDLASLGESAHEKLRCSAS